MASLPDGAHHRSGRALRKRLKEDLMGAIVCGVDDSASAKEAARVARALSAKLGHRLVFVSVVETLSPCEKVSMLVEQLQHPARDGTEVDCGASLLVDVNHLVDRLVAAAAEEKASFIVVGSNGPYSSLVGNISAETPRRAPCPVVVVPPGSDERPTNDHQRLHETNDRNTRDFAGGIVRFSLGSRTKQS
jgi:nucleotide-binding universal stress UspA family protein